MRDFSAISRAVFLKNFTSVRVDDYLPHSFNLRQCVQDPSEKRLTCKVAKVFAGYSLAVCLNRQQGDDFSGVSEEFINLRLVELLPAGNTEFGCVRYHGDV